MTPLKPIAPTTKVALGILFFVVFVAIWSLATFGGFVSKTFLADPLTMVREGIDRAVVLEWLRSSLASGLSNLDEIAAAAAGSQGQSATALHSYLRDALHYVLGERDAQGIETFHKLCLRYNLVPTRMPTRTPVAAGS